MKTKGVWNNENKRRGKATVFPTPFIVLLIFAGYPHS
jgi:hypothetical protein